MPRDYLKFFVLLAFSIFVITINKLALMFLVLFGSIFIALIILGWPSFWAGLKPLLIVFGMVLLFNLVFLYNFDVLYRLEYGILSASKIVSFSLGLLVFNLTTSTSRLVALLWFVPKSIKLMLVIAFSLMPLVIFEFNQIKLAQKARGYKVGGWNIFKTTLPLVVPLLHRTLNRAEQIAIVIQSRGGS